ncbi:MAG: hypothetical protein GY940_36320 [bacterium]|nr:hypothetical protein [bacterium]
MIKPNQNNDKTTHQKEHSKPSINEIINPNPSPPETGMISTLENSPYYFLHFVFIQKQEDHFRLVVFHEELCRLDKSFETLEETQRSFSDNYGLQAWKTGIKPQWSPFHFYIPYTHNEDLYNREISPYILQLLEEDGFKINEIFTDPDYDPSKGITTPNKPCRKSTPENKVKAFMFLVYYLKKFPGFLDHVTNEFIREWKPRIDGNIFKM